MSKSVKVLVFSAMCIALASITSLIKVFEFPTGGSITLASTLFAVLPGYFFGDPTLELPREAKDVLDTKLDDKGKLAQDIPLPAEAKPVTPVAASSRLSSSSETCRFRPSARMR